ncbi:MAG: UDP-N-acetylmuramoyl-tripeptide--D-alanyl-D-alanine ligase [Clostridia bacterium]|nr:UDP-N-acetylmuramoyl-tripeptide--D-alanyl-D-alanine ligase [Clostridia bacterium]
MKIQFSADTVSFGTLARLCGGELRQGELGSVCARFLCTDSREANDQTVFVALRGERVDGHNFITGAIERGCRCVICEHDGEELVRAGVTAIVVGDTELALAKLANGYQAQYLHSKNVAVTGSVGKTTTKDLVAAVLSVGRKTYKTEGNHNSLVGMPLSMLETPEDSAYSVLEMGMSSFGEIERLSIAATPQIAIITNIGTSHMEMLGSRENICRAKLEVLCGLRDNGILLLNGDEPLLRGIKGKSYRTQYVSLQCEKADYFAKNIKVEPDGTRFDAVCQGEEIRDLRIHLVGRHNVYAALYAIAVARIAGLEAEQIRQGLYSYLPEGMRQHFYTLGDITVIEDCYNAAPESVSAAIDVLEEYGRDTGKRTVAVLGDMLELGEDSPALHRTVGAHLAQRGIAQLFTLGKEAVQIAVGARQKGMPKEQIHMTEDVTDIQGVGESLLASLRKGDVVLFKASRAVGAEQIIAYLRERM